jgi:hypothetical protein
MDEHIEDLYFADCLNLFFQSIPRDAAFDPADILKTVFLKVPVGSLSDEKKQELEKYCLEAIPHSLADDKIITAAHGTASLTEEGKDIWDSANKN